MDTMMIFRSTDTSYRDRSGTPVAIVRPLNDEEHDRDEVGDMFRVRFSDGAEADAFVDELAAPAMTPERARFILSNKTIGGGLRFAFDRFGGANETYPDGITPEEHAAIMNRWRLMDGSRCYFDALCEIAR
jgi:hypothetical protein